MNTTKHPTNESIISRRPRLRTTLVDPTRHVSRLHPSTLTIRSMQNRNSTMPHQFSNNRRNQMNLLTVSGQLSTITTNRQLTNNTSRRIHRANGQHQCDLKRHKQRTLPGDVVYSQGGPPHPPLMAISTRRPVRRQATRQRRNSRRCPRHNQSQIALMSSHIPHYKSDSHRQRRNNYPYRPIKIKRSDLPSLGVHHPPTSSYT